MKRILSFLLLLWLFLSVIPLSAGDVILLDSRTEQEAWIRQEAVASDGEFLPPAQFQLRVGEQGLNLELMLLMEDASPIASRPGFVEITLGDCTFSGIIRNTPPFPRQLRPALDLLGIVWSPRMEIMPQYDREMPLLRNYILTCDFLPHTVVLHLQIPWSDLLSVLLPIGATAAECRIPFHIYRTFSGRRFCVWSGELAFADTANDALLRKYYRNAALKTCERPFIQCWDFAAESLGEGMANLERKLQQSYAQIPADPMALSIPRWQALLAGLRETASGLHRKPDGTTVYEPGFKAPVGSSDSAVPPRAADGSISAPFLSRHQKHTVHMISAPPAVAWYGADRLVALSAHDAFQKFAQTVPTVACGIAGDRPAGILWRIGNGALQRVKPGYVVLYLEPETVPESLLLEMLNAIHRQCPDTQILLLATGNAELDSELKKLADPGKKIRFAALEDRSPEALCAAVEQILIADLEQSMEQKDRPVW